MVIRIYIALLIVLTLVSCKKEYSTPDYENHRTYYYKNVNIQSYDDSIISCVTYNIQLGFKANQDPWDKNQIGTTDEQLNNLVIILKRFNPDIIALQEVPKNRYNSEIKDYIEKLSEKLNMNYAFGAHGYNDAYGIYPVYGEWGNAILTKYQILDIANIEVVNISNWEKRSIIDAKLKINDSLTINSVSLHYLTSFDNFENEFNKTRLHLKELLNPIILMGDFNCYPSEKFSEIGLIDSDTTFSFGVDRILFSKKDFCMIEKDSFYDTTNWTSDHPANSCKLRIKIK